MVSCHFTGVTSRSPVAHGDQPGIAAGGRRVDRDRLFDREAHQGNAGRPALKPVPDRPEPPKGWVPTTAPIMLRLT